MATEELKSFTFEQLEAEIDGLIQAKTSFEVLGLGGIVGFGGRMSQAIKLIERKVEENSMKCLVYTKGRGWTMLIPPVTVYSAALILAHRVVVGDCDYEIAKHLVHHKLTVTYMR